MRGSRNGAARGRRDLRASIADGMAFGGMVGFGETYLPAFALALGLGEMVAGMMASVPLVAGGLMQLVSPFAVRLLRSHRRWVITCSIVQALSFVPLFLAALAGWISGFGLLMVAAVYWAAGLATGPAWNTWIGTLVRRPIRARFFAHRTRLSQAAVFGGVALGGISLQFADQRQSSMTAFAGLFACAGLCRLFSAGMLVLQSEPVPLPANMRHIPWSRIFHHLSAGSGGRLLVYLAAVQAASQISGPFFTPFMLEKLDFSYGQLVMLLASAFLAKVIALPAWGQVAKRTGARRLLQIGGLSIVPISALWVVSQQFAWLCVVQVAGGIAWAAYELAFFLLFFESIPEEERTSVLTLYNLLNTSAIVCGALIGALILRVLDTGFSAYLVVFLVSTGGRVLTVGLLARVPSITVDVGEVGVRTVSVRPGSGSIDAPVLPSMPDRLERGD